jgi:predicted TIM-barrel fold metal-dependent hydrolase
MNRRDFVKVGLAAAMTRTFSTLAAAPPTAGRAAIIDTHCHAGRGLNHGQEDADPWTTYNDPQWTLRRMEEAGISRTVIFPINNVTYEQANQEIAEYARRWPSKLIGFAKHDAKTEAGRIGDLLRHEVRDLGLKGLKLPPEKEALVLGGNIRRLLRLDFPARG